MDGMIYTFPIIGALLGWITNYLAIKMLFHPRKPYRVFGINIQGVFPKRQKMIAVRLGKLVSEELLSADDIRNTLSDQSRFHQLKDTVSYKLDDYLKNDLPKQYPFISLFVSSKTKGKIRDSFANEFETQAPILVENYLDNIQNELNIELIVQEKVEALSPEKLEKLIHQVMNKELQFIEIVGGVLGFIVGTVQMVMALYLL